MNQSLPPVRRIVTGHDADGRAVIIEDRDAPAVRRIAERPGYQVTQLWMSSQSPVAIDAPDRSGEISGVAPPPRGTVLRMIDFPPESADPVERERAAHATFNALYSDAHKDDASKLHPAMHRTDTVDYAIVMSGEITAILEDGETLMRAGDVMIQRGTIHAWANRSGKLCRMAFVLIDGER